MDETSYTRFQYALDHPLEGEKRWMRKVEKLVASASPTTENTVIWVYVFDRVNFSYITHSSPARFVGDIGMLTTATGSFSSSLGRSWWPPRRAA
jgi:hypothetical protein